jgi:Aerotolerance regulator N-terminal
MNWASLTFGDVALLSAFAAAVAIWLYLRQPRAARLRVSTLRFWESSPSGSSTARRRRLREPWALLAQIVFLLLVIAALGNPRWGAVTQGRSVVVVLDAGVWSQMRSARGVPWINDVRAQTDALLQRLPPDDRVLLLRADSDGAPLLPFTTDRSALRAAIANLQPSSAVPDIPRALAEGRDALEPTAATPKGTPRGLLVYVGPGLMDREQSDAFASFQQSLAAEPVGDASTPPNTVNSPPEFLVRLAGDASPLKDVGITQMALRRSGGEPDEWLVMTQVKNYNDLPAHVTLSLSVGGNVFRQDALSIAPGATQSASDDFTSRSGGLLQAEITPSDSLPADNRATIVLPSSMPVSVAVVTSRASFAAKMRAVLSANPYVKTDFVRAGAAAPSTADVVIYDGPVPAGVSEPATISFLAPPKESAHRVRLGNWNSGHPVARWIQSRDVTVRPGETLKPAADDVVLASSSDSNSEPLILAHQANAKRSVVVDFDPLDSNFTDEPAFPLLMAASIEWMTHPIAESGDFMTSGSIDLTLAPSRVVSPSGRDLLFAGDNSGAHFFAGESGLYRVSVGGQLLSMPVNVPLLPTIRMTPTSAEAAPLEAQPIAIEQQDLWRWLVALALIALWLEWQFFYCRRDRASGTRASSASGGTLQIDLRDAVHETERERPVVGR